MRISDWSSDVCSSDLYGFGWILLLFWRMDKAWRGVRFDTAWVNRSPIDYVRERVRFATQPLDEPQNPQDLYRMIDMLGDRHAGAEPARPVARGAPASLRRQRPSHFPLLTTERQ